MNKQAKCEVRRYNCCKTIHGSLLLCRHLYATVHTKNDRQNDYSTTCVLTIKRSPSIASVVDCSPKIKYRLLSHRYFYFGKQGLSELLPLDRASVYSWRPWIVAMPLSEAVFLLAICNISILVYSQYLRLEGNGAGFVVGLNCYHWEAVGQR